MGFSLPSSPLQQQFDLILIPKSFVDSDGLRHSVTIIEQMEFYLFPVYSAIVIDVSHALSHSKGRILTDIRRCSG
jgi:hypothetical protein